MIDYARRGPHWENRSLRARECDHSPEHQKQAEYYSRVAGILEKVALGVVS